VSFRCLEAVTAVAANIKWLFAIYPLQDEVVFLALWYASHIMPEGVLDQFDLYQPDGIVLATRLFVLSYTLAIKWLSDETYSLQHWYVLQVYDQFIKLMVFLGFHTTRRVFRFLLPKHSIRRRWNCLTTISIFLPFNGQPGCTN
jgi:hypothetical protein